jgi:hypothetical protein
MLAALWEGVRVGAQSSRTFRLLHDISATLPKSVAAPRGYFSAKRENRCGGPEGYNSVFTSRQTILQ